MLSDEMNPNQNQPVSCTEITPASSLTRIRSSFIRYAATPPHTALMIENAWRFALCLRSKPNTSTASISKGINQSRTCSCRARSSPLTESFAPPQLICSQGRKKQMSTMIAALRLIRRSMPLFCSLTVGKRLGVGSLRRHPQPCPESAGGKIESLRVDSSGLCVSVSTLTKKNLPRRHGEHGNVSPTDSSHTESQLQTTSTAAPLIASCFSAIKASFASFNGKLWT